MPSIRLEKRRSAIPIAETLGQQFGLERPSIQLVSGQTEDGCRSWFLRDKAHQSRHATVASTFLNDAFIGFTNLNIKV